MATADVSKWFIIRWTDICIELFQHTTCLQKTTRQNLCKTIIKRMHNYQKELKKLWQKENLIKISNFSFYHNDSQLSNPAVSTYRTGYFFQKGFASDLPKVYSVCEKVKHKHILLKNEIYHRGRGN